MEHQDRLILYQKPYTFERPSFYDVLLGTGHLSGIYNVQSHFRETKYTCQLVQFLLQSLYIWIAKTWSLAALMIMKNQSWWRSARATTSTENIIVRVYVS